MAYWINNYYDLPEAERIDKQDELVHKIKAMIDEQYAGGRTTVMGDDELDSMVAMIDPKRHKALLILAE